MKGMPLLPFEFHGKGTAGFRQPAATEFVVPCAEKLVHFEDLVKIKLIGEEPKSVLDNINSSPSPPNSTSTLSSSPAGDGGRKTVGAVAVSGDPWLQQPENRETGGSNVGVLLLHGHNQLPEQSLDVAGGDEKCGEMEDWESVLSESGQEQSILRWIMGDVEDPSMGLNKMLHGGGTADDGELSGGFGVVDQAFLGFDSNNNPVDQIGNLNFYQFPHKLTNDKIGLTSNALPSAPAPEIFSGHLHNHHNQKLSHLQNPSETHPFDVKPQIFNSQFIINHNPAIFRPQEPKRHKTPFLDSSPTTKLSAIDEPELHHHQSTIDELFKAADVIQSGNNPILAQAILARLNHHVSPIGKPFIRAAFYFKESLQSLTNSIINNVNPQLNPIGSPFSLIFKIGAYKSFSEISPFVQFTNFTCNQALLETLDGFNHIHIIDFDISYGSQWASFIQELSLRNNNSKNGVTLKITAFASPTTHDELELTLTRENLIHFANEMNVGFDFEIVNIDVLALRSWEFPFRASDHEAVGVNLPICAFSNFQIPIALVLRFIKNLAPKIVVCVDKGCERTDLPFANHLVHALQSYSNLLDSLDAVNMNLDVLQKIERFLIQPGIEKIVTGRFLFPGRAQNWQSQFLSSGFSPLTFSNFTESQAECVIKRSPVRGFHVEKRQSSLVLCWQRHELVSASAWRC